MQVLLNKIYTHLCLARDVCFARTTTFVNIGLRLSRLLRELRAKFQQHLRDSQIIKVIFNPAYPTYLALDLTSANVRLLQLCRYKGRYYVENIFCEQMIFKGKESDYADSIIQVIIKFLQNKSLEKMKVVIAVSYSGIIAKTITISNQLKEKEIEEFLALNIGQYINAPREEIDFDYQLVRSSIEESNQTRIELIAARKENLRKCMVVLDKVGLKANVIDVDAYALARVGNLMSVNGADFAEAHALINLEHEKMLIGIVIKSKLLCAQEYFIDQDILYEVELLVKQIVINLQLCLAHMNLHIQSLQADVQKCSSSYNEHIKTVVLCGSYAGIKNLVENLQQAIHIKTVLANPFCEMIFAPHINKTEVMKKAYAMTLCSGLAIRESGSFNLLPWRQELVNKKQRTFQITLFVFFMLGLLITGSLHLMLEYKINAADAKQQAMLPQVAKAQKLEKQAKIVADKIAALNVSLGEIKTLQDNQAVNAALLSLLSQITPQAIQLISLQKDNTLVSINGQTNSMNALAEFMQKIAKINLFTQPQIQEIKNIAEQENVFTMTVNLKRSS